MGATIQSSVEFGSAYTKVQQETVLFQGLKEKLEAEWSGDLPYFSIVSWDFCKSPLLSSLSIITNSLQAPLFDYSYCAFAPAVFKINNSNIRVYVQSMLSV